MCWVDNWSECPEWIEVIELSKVVRGDVRSFHRGGAETRRKTFETRREGAGVQNADCECNGDFTPTDMSV